VAVRQLLEEWFPLGGVILLSPRWRSAEDSFLFLLFKAFAVDSACRRVHVTLVPEYGSHGDRSH